MRVSRGDVILVYVLNVGSPGGKVRPALVVQSDHNNVRLDETIIAAITSKVSRVHEATQLLIDVSTADGAASGLPLPDRESCYPDRLSSVVLESRHAGGRRPAARSESEHEHRPT